MKILEQILQEIDARVYDLQTDAGRYEDSGRQGEADKIDYEIKGLHTAAKIIRFHMEDDGWIPVEQRLPTREEYLKDDGRFMLDDGNRRYQGLFNIYDGKFMFSKHISGINYELFEDKCVIAWQPLPAPYKSD